MTIVSWGKLLALVAVAAALAACGGDNLQPSPGPLSTPTPHATSTADPSPSPTARPTADPSPTATASPPTSTPTTTPSPSPTPTPSTTPSPTPTPATTTPAPTPDEPEAPTFRYDTYDTTGAVSTAGSYAFLSDADDTSTAVTTYEGLRDGTTTALLIHKSDRDGSSQATFFDAVGAGDLFEWRQADDCFVRYTVTEVKPDPAGTGPRKLLAVEWMTYAYTGCTGTISTSAAVGMAWSDLRDLGGVGLPAPVVHGTFHLAPENWEGKTMAGTHHDPPDTSPELEETSVDTLAAARTQDFPYWREPSTMPEGWELSRAWEGGLDAPWYGFCSVYVTNPRQKTINACGFFNTNRRFAKESSYFVEAGLVARETRVIAGRPALIIWSPPGPHYIWWLDVYITVNDPDTESSYGFIATGPGRSDLAADGQAKLDSVIAFVRTFFESPEEE